MLPPLPHFLREPFCATPSSYIIECKLLGAETRHRKPHAHRRVPKQPSDRGWCPVLTWTPQPHGAMLARDPIGHPALGHPAAGQLRSHVMDPAKDSLQEDPGRAGQGEPSEFPAIPSFCITPHRLESLPRSPYAEGSSRSPGMRRIFSSPCPPASESGGRGAVFLAPTCGSTRCLRLWLHPQIQAVTFWAADAAAALPRRTWVGLRCLGVPIPLLPQTLKRV